MSEKDLGGMEVPLEKAREGVHVKYRGKGIRGRDCAGSATCKASR